MEAGGFAAAAREMLGGTIEARRTQHAPLFALWLPKFGQQVAFAGARGEQSHTINCVMWANNAEPLRDAAIHHQGIAMLPTFIASEALQSGQLRTLLDNHPPSDITLSALYLRHRHLSTKVRLLIDLLAERFGAHPYWDWAQ